MGYLIATDSNATDANEKLHPHRQCVEERRMTLVRRDGSSGLALVWPMNKRPK